MAILADLAIRLKSNSAQLRTDLDASKKKIKEVKETSKDTAKGTKESIGSLGNSFSSLKGIVGDSLGGITGQLGGMMEPLKGVFSGFKLGIPTLNSFKIALAGTGIGLIVVALGSLMAYLQGTKEGFEIINKVTSVASAIFGTVLTRLQDIGGAIVKLFQGDFAGAWADAKKAVSGFGDAVTEAYDRGKSAADKEIELIKRKNKFIIESAKLQLSISELQRKAKDKENFSEAERLEFAKKAIDQQNKLSKEKIGIAKQELALIELQNQGLNITYEKEAEINTKKADLLMIEKEQNDIIKGLNDEKLGILGEYQSILKAETDAIKALQTSFTVNKDISNVLDEYINSMNKKDAKIDDIIDWSAFEFPEEMINENDQKVIDNLSAKYKTVTDLSSQTSQLVRQSMQDMFSGLGESIGNFVAGDLSSLKGFFDGFLNLIIDFGKQFGKLLIAAGIASDALKAVGISGIGAVIAGTALVAASTAASGLLSKGAGTDNIKGFANGGIIPSNSGMSLVGENGPELISNSAYGGSRVYTNSQSKSMLAGSNTMQLQMQPIIIGGDQLAIVLDSYNRKKAGSR